MKSFSEAYALIMNHALETRPESVSLQHAAGRFPVEAVASPIDSPPFDKSAMDGFAVPDREAKGSYRILETVAAGETPTQPLVPGTCIRIMTGAMIPDGCTQVVRVEYTSEADEIMTVETPEPYENIIRRGENLKKGDEFLPVKRLTSKEIGSLAASGISRVMVHRKLVIGIITTGSELKEPGETLSPGEIYNSNGYQLRCQIEAAGGEALVYGVIPDDRERHAEVIRKGLDECDILLLSGGVSKGDFDYVPETLKEAGVEILIHGILVKPGRPTLFGRHATGFVFGLPGNPVSTFILFETLVKPFIMSLNGVEYRPPVMQGRLTKEIRRRDTERLEFRPVSLQGKGDGASGIESMAARELIPVRYKGSAHMNAMVETDGVVLMQPGVAQLDEGAIVDVRLI